MCIMRTLLYYEHLINVYYENSVILWDLINECYENSVILWDLINVYYEDSVILWAHN